MDSLRKTGGTLLQHLPRDPQVKEVAMPTATAEEGSFTISAVLPTTIPAACPSNSETVTSAFQDPADSVLDFSKCLVRERD